MDDYPHQMSGGMRQRVMIAIALACDPAVLIADEPTTALDVTVQAQIFDLLREQQARRGTAVLMITHDMGAVSEMADRIVVMYGGRIVEQGACRDVLTEPLHPYTQGLIACLPELTASRDEARPDLPEIPAWCRRSGIAGRAVRSRRAAKRATRAAASVSALARRRGLARCMGTPMPQWLPTRRHPARMAWPAGFMRGGAIMIQTPTSTPASIHTPAPAASAPLLSVRDLAVHFPVAGGGGRTATVKAVDGVSFELARGRTLAIVGESGSGKTTTALSVLRLSEPTAGAIHFDGQDLTALRGEPLRAHAPPVAAGVPGSVFLAQSAPARGDIVRAPLT